MKWTWKILLIGISIATLGAMFGTAGNENVDGFMGLGFLLAIVGLVGVAAGSGVKQRKAAKPAPIHNHVSISLDMHELQRLIREEVRLGLENRQSEYIDSGQHPRKVSYVSNAKRMLTRK